MRSLLPVNKIIPSSCVDGPGNRTVVFFQGCNFNCTYCHNPETINRCNDCGLCVPGCPSNALTLHDGKVAWDQERCIGCDGCISVCPHSASPKVRFLNVEEVAVEVERNLPFIRGVTFSGGECMLQAELLAPLSERLHESVGSVLLDSNGSIDFSTQLSLLNACDGVMLDMKCFNEKSHKELTGKSNKAVLQNAEYLAKNGKLTEVRTVVIPEVLPNEETVIQTAKLIASHIPDGLTVTYKLIRFRAHGTKKEAKKYETPTLEYMRKLKQLVAGYSCLEVKII
ncbi:YjjW family glycine radical enzyme activase [Pleomorphochaeta sp. DL1XJH-081]|uniref:YjjW family glycine radical enzyme activase n=1 Tax=Pleomorphochaeta sp. DL1XJH-081 TaxID=3409690 RepID=UPI003BB7A3F6